MNNNTFLKVDKDLFNLGLNPAQILIIAQVMEFQRNNCDCYITDKQLSENFGVSEKTISREIKNLIDLQFLSKETTNTRSGRKRKLYIKYPTDNLTGANGQNDLCPTDNLSNANGQNDLIKDNIKDNIKEKEKEAAEDYPTITRDKLNTAPVEIEWISDDLVYIPNSNKTFKVID